MKTTLDYVKADCWGLTKAPSLEGAM